MTTQLNRRFTLVELLVVIAIISILAALLLPSLQKAQDSALQASCLSNQKQISLGIMMYLGEFDDFLPYNSLWNLDYTYHVAKYLGLRNDALTVDQNKWYAAYEPKGVLFCPAVASSATSSPMWLATATLRDRYYSSYVPTAPEGRSNVGLSDRGGWVARLSNGTVPAVGSASLWRRIRDLPVRSILFGDGDYRSSNSTYNQPSPLLGKAYSQYHPLYKTVSGNYYYGWNHNSHASISLTAVDGSAKIYNWTGQNIFIPATNDASNIDFIPMF